MDYMEFLERKRTHVPHSGFDPGDGVSDALFPFQRDIVRWAVMGGRRAIFAAFGLGKSVMQLEIMRLVQAHEGGRALIVCPLGVRQEFKRDAGLLGMEVEFVRRTCELGGDGELRERPRRQARPQRVQGGDARRGERAPELRLEDLPDVP